MSNFNSLSIDEKIINLTGRATKLWCGNGVTEAAGPVFYGWRGKFFTSIFQAHFIIYTFDDGKEKDRIESSIVEWYNMDGALNLLNDFLTEKETEEQKRIARDRALICLERSEIVESVGFAD